MMCVQCTCWNASETIARMEEGSLNSVLRCIFCGRQITKYIDAHCNKVEFWSVLAFFVAFSSSTTKYILVHLSKFRANSDRVRLGTGGAGASIE